MHGQAVNRAFDSWGSRQIYCALNMVYNWHLEVCPTRRRFELETQRPERDKSNECTKDLGPLAVPCLPHSNCHRVGLFLVCSAVRLALPRALKLESVFPSWS